MSKTLDAMRAAAVANGLHLYGITEILHGKSETVQIIPGANCHNTYSVAKVFTVTAIGMLEDRGLLSTDDPVSRFFPVPDSENWKKLKIAHLLEHKMGIGCGFLDIDCEYAPDWGSDDYLALTFARDLPYEPGTQYQYSDGAFYLASRVFSAASGEKMDDFLARELFYPLHFREFAFSKCPKGYPIGATGLYITTEDLAKLGSLYLRRGEVDGRRYLSERFIEKALGRFDLTPAYGGFAKGGMNGQYLYFNREKDQVIAWLGHNPGKNVTQILMDAGNG